MPLPLALLFALVLLPAPRPTARYAKLNVVVRGDIEVGEIARRVDELRAAARILLNVDEGQPAPVDVETSILADGEASISTSMVFSMVVGGAPPLAPS